MGTAAPRRQKMPCSPPRVNTLQGRREETEKTTGEKPTSLGAEEERNVRRGERASERRKKGPWSGREEREDEPDLL